MNSHFLSSNTHIGSLLPIKNNLIKSDENTRFLSHFDISYTDIINNNKPFDSLLENKVLDHYDMNNIFVRDIERKGLILNFEADKASNGIKAGSSLYKSTTMWHDESGNCRNLIFDSLYHDDLNKWTNEDGVNCLRVDNTMATANLNDKLLFDEVTHEAWIKVNAIGNEYSTVCLLLNEAGSSTNYMSISKDLKVATFWYDKNSQGYHHSESSINIGRWTHIAVTWSRGELDREYVTFYIDGVKDKQITINQFTSGRQYHAKARMFKESESRRLKAYVNSYRLYGRALSDSEIRNNYLKGMQSIYGIKNSIAGSPMLMFNNPQIANGHNGYGIKFDGQYNYAKYTSKQLNANASFYSRFSIESFVDGTELFTQGDRERGLILASGYLSYYMKQQDGTIVECKKSPHGIAANSPVSVMCTNTFDTMKMFINGSEVASQSIERNKIKNDEPTFYGMDQKYGTSSMIKDGDIYRVSIDRNSSETGNAWPCIRFPKYSFTPGLSYKLLIDVRIISRGGSAGVQVRHASVTNDYWTDGRILIGFQGYPIGEWKTIECDRSFYSTYTNSNNDVWTTEPKIEIYTDIHKPGDNIVFEFKNARIVADEYSNEFTICKNTKATVCEFSTYNTMLSNIEIDMINKGMVSTLNEISQEEKYDFGKMLVGHWPLQNDYADISQNNLNLTAGGSGVNATSIDRIKCMKFKDSYLYVQDQEKTDIEGEVSISCWFNTSNINAYQHFICKGNDDGQGNDFMLGIHNKKLYSKATVIGYDNSGVKSIQTLYSNYELIPNRWYHAGYVFDGKTIRVYLDGKLVGEKNIGAGRYNIACSNNPLRIGSERAATNVMDGYISNMRLYSRALSQEEMTALSRDKHLLTNNNYKYGGNLQMDKPTVNLVGGRTNEY